MTVSAPQWFAGLGLPVAPTDLAVEVADLEGVDAAVFSRDRVYRYALTRRWGPGPLAVWVMLNPSTADAFRLDPTLTRCRAFAQGWGCGGMTILNLFALRSTDPDAMLAHPDPVGPHNDAFLRRAVELTRVRDEHGNPAVAHVVVGWGAHALAAARAAEVAELIAAVPGAGAVALGTTKAGAPRHPLYMRADAALRPWPGP